MRRLLTFFLFPCLLLPCFHLFSFEGNEAFLKTRKIDPTLREHVINFYAKELLLAGVFDEEDSAFGAAEQECMLETFNNPDKKLHSFQIVSYKGFENFGYLIYSQENAEKAFLEALWIEPKFRGRGFGKSSLRALEKKLILSDIHEIELSCFAHNKAALSLYRNMGFTINKSFFANGKEISHKMHKLLKPGF